MPTVTADHFDPVEQAVSFYCASHLARANLVVQCYTRECFQCKAATFHVYFVFYV